MTDTTNRGRAEVPPALLSGYLVILKAPPLGPIREIMPPDWFPILTDVGDWLREWQKVLHG